LKSSLGEAKAKLNCAAAVGKNDCIAEVAHQKNASSAENTDVFGRSRVGQRIGVKAVAFVANEEVNFASGALSANINVLVGARAIAVYNGVADGLGQGNEHITKQIFAYIKLT
jgi:hypothetical protein